MENSTDNEHIKSEIFKLAEMKYSCCAYSDIPQKTKELKSILLHTEKLNTLDIGLLKSCVRRILVSHFCTIEIEFINGVIINERGEKL
jgi:DNA-directed RNA polymerase subunit N (RpoN/RPB10)